MTDVSALHQHAQHLLEVDRPHEALDVLSPHLAEHQEDVLALCFAAAAFIALDDGQRAFDIATSAVEFAPEDSVAWRLASIGASMLKRHEVAAHCADRVIELDPQSWLGYERRASVDNDSGRVTGATLAWAREAVRLGPDQPHAHTTLASSALLTRKFTKARTSAREALRLDPQNVVARQLDSLLRMNSDPGSAAAGFVDVLANRPGDRDALGFLRLAASVAVGQVQIIVALVIIAVVQGRRLVPSLYPNPEIPYSMPFQPVLLFALVVVVGALAIYVARVRAQAGPAFGRFVRSVPHTDKSLVVRLVLLSGSVLLMAAAAAAIEGTRWFYSIAFMLVLASTVVWVVHQRALRHRERELAAAR